MRVAFDLDGVLADLHTPFVSTAGHMFPELDRQAIRSADIAASPPDGEEPKNGDLPSAAVAAPVAAPSVPLTRRQSDQVWRALAATENFWEGLKEIEEGAIRKLAAVADERRWEVLFITSRPKSHGRTVQRQSQRWLEQHGFPLPSVYVVHGSRGRVAEALALDVVIDDRPDNCLDVVLESKAGALLVWRGPENTVPSSARRLGIAAVPTVDKVLAALIAAEKDNEGGGVLDRLRRLFGLKTRSASPLIRS
jgi:hypothetical protein